MTDTKEEIQRIEPTPLWLPPSLAFAVGFASGLTTSTREASLRFLAENAHRKPDSLKGWYFYRRTKNYVILQNAIKGGFKTGGKLAIWTCGFLFTQEIINRGFTSISNVLHTSTLSRKQIEQDEISRSLTILSSKSLSGTLSGLILASVVNRKYFNSYSSRRSLSLIGASAGLMIGLVEDVKRNLANRESSS